MILYSNRVAFTVDEATCTKEEPEAIPSSRADGFTVADADQAVFGKRDDGAGGSGVEIILNQLDEEVIFV